MARFWGEFRASRYRGTGREGAYHIVRVYGCTYHGYDIFICVYVSICDELLDRMELVWRSSGVRALEQDASAGGSGLCVSLTQDSV